MPTHPRPINAVRAFHSRLCVDRTRSDPGAVLTPQITNFRSGSEEEKGRTLWHKTNSYISSTQLHDHAVSASNYNHPNAPSTHPGRWQL